MKKLIEARLFITVITVITTMATLGACANQMGCASEREYRNPYLRAKHISAPAESTNGGQSSCLAQQQPAQ
jgi:hypothetical protein